jgi:acyl-CoA hydrolase
VVDAPRSGPAPGDGAVGFPFLDVLRPGDRISFGQACSEPVGLVRELVRPAPDLHARLGRLKLFVAGSYSGLLRADHSAWFDFASYGAFGDVAALLQAGVADLHPVPYSRLPELLTGELPVDVVLLQLSPPDAAGRYSLGVASDFQLAAARRARVVVAEVNQKTPFSPGALVPEDLRIDHVVHTDEPLVEFPAAPIDDISRQVAAHVAALVPDRATLQMGIGSLMEAICHALQSHRGLGVHTGILTDGLAELMRSGSINNENKGSFPGQSVAASLLGTRQLFEFAHGNAAVRLVETAISHGAPSLARVQRFCSINSAVEIDLTGQVNAEVSRGRYVGAVGGQPDYIRAAASCESGLSIIALPSVAGRARTSRIVTQLAGPATTPRSDVHWVVTEWGAANLRNTSLRGRAKALAAIAHPDHRDTLSREADELPAW